MFRGRVIFTVYKGEDKTAQGGRRRRIPASGANMMLIGRTAEMMVIQSLLGEMRAGSGRALVLRGQPGVGKTALLQETAERAVIAGTRLARAGGSQAEQGFDFAGLHQLLLPFLGGLPDLPVSQSAVLETVFGLAAGRAANPLLVGPATFSLLTNVAEKQPLLCVIDDAHWLDRASQQVLVFAARRLVATRVGMIFSRRDGEEGAEAFSDFPQLQVAALSPDNTRELLEMVAAGSVGELVLRRVLAEADGNPQTLVEMVRELKEGRGIRDVASGLPMRVGDRMKWLYLDQVRRLPAEARTLLVVAAAEHLGDPQKVWRAAHLLGLDPDVTTLREVSRVLSLSHPLMRAAAYWDVPPGERRRVHAALAEVTDPQTDLDRRAWHLAEATKGPDDAVAAQLEASADQARRRGGWQSEQTFLRRAAQLTTNPERQAERQMAAAEAALAAGDTTSAERLAEQAIPDLTQPLMLSRARRVQGRCLQARGRTTEAVRTLASAAVQMGTADPVQAHDTMLEALTAAQVNGWFGPECAEVVQAARSLRRVSAEVPGNGLMEGYAAIHEGRIADGYGLLRKGIESMAAACDAPDTPLPRMLAWHQAAGLLFEHSAWDDQERWVPTLREHGAVTTLIVMLFSLGCYLLRVGRLTAAEAALAEGRALAEATGNRGWLEGYATVDVWLRGLSGNAPEGRDLAARLLEEQIPRLWRDFTQLGVAVLELGSGRYGAALDAALEAKALWPLLSPEDAVEAAVRCGRPEVGQAAFDDFAPLAAAAGSPWALGVAARCRALLARDACRADSDYQQSIHCLHDTPVVLALNRSRLVYGEWLRRQRRRRDARAQLRLALEGFEQMGVGGFAARARAELAATCEHARARSHPVLQLTPQELRIAQLAADGATNRDIATRLFLSAGTINYHLRSIYRKLGVSRRVLLAQALSTAGLAA